MVSENTRYWILIGLVTISGFSQGMLLPLIAIILEQNGVSSSVNGLHATALYFGVLIASPFIEKPLQKLGFKPIIAIGGVLVFTSLALFPVWQSLWIWFMLRLIVGIGDHLLHFGTQTWITTTVSEATRGRSIAFYGLSFGLGFMLGPLMTRLLVINESLPFIISSLVSMLVWSTLFFVKNMWPEQDIDSIHSTNSLNRFIQIGKVAWIALLPGFGFGILEATLHGVFPIYGLRIGHDIGMLSIIIPCFAAGSLISQLPLGILSDRFGRRRVLLYALFIGAICFIFAGFLETSVFALLITFTLAGIFVGSLFSLGISFMVDLLPKSLLPAGNLMIGISFSLGSIGGPLIGGLYIQLFPNISFLYMIAAMLMLIFIAVYLKNDHPHQTEKHPAI